MTKNGYFMVYFLMIESINLDTGNLMVESRIKNKVVISPVGLTRQFIFFRPSNLTGGSFAAP